MIDASAIQQFKTRFGGTLLAPGSAEYEAARTVFNAMIDRRPALIAQCVNAGDVIEAVNFAREQKLLTSVRCTGHHVGGYAVCDGGLVIDLSRMKAIRVDAAAGTVRAGGGCNWGEVNDALQPHGLAATGGFVSVTGVSGLTLGGGLGWLVRKHGLALDNLISAEMVLADGRLVTRAPPSTMTCFGRSAALAAILGSSRISSSRRTPSEPARRHRSPPGRACNRRDSALARF